MPGTPDRFPGVREDEGVLLEDAGVDPTQVGEIRLNGSDLKAKDGTGVFNLRSGSGITVTQHEILRQLIHFVDDGPANGFPSGSYKETLPAANPFPTSEIWWESSAKLKKIVELIVTRNANKTPATEVWEMYDTDGSTVLATVTDTISYSGIFETSRTRAIA